MKTFRQTLLPLLAASCLSVAAQEDFSITVFDSPDNPASVTAPSHRIPALAETCDGTLLAVADYRYNLSDVGTSGKSRIELWCRTSTDMGRTWSQHRVVHPASEDRSDWHYAMGDAALVADRESPDVMLFCAAGSVGMGASTASRPIRIGCFRSADGGLTWDEGTDVTQQIYGLFDGDATAIFITSGRLCQSRYVKTGPNYRVYAAFPVRTASRGNSTGVIYSDDFGHTWQLLGGPGAPFPEGTVYEEGKIEEMPDGNLALMVRDDRGTAGTDVPEKNFNYFRYDDVSAGTGQWSRAVSGITGMANACNSAFIAVPARRRADGRQCCVMLTTVPLHTVSARNATDNYGRRSVAFFYKELGCPADYNTGQALAAGWQQGMQVTDLCSAYADLLLLSDGHVGLLLEDNGRQGTGVDGNRETEAYDIVYHHLALSTVTLGHYDADTAYDAHADLLQGLAPALRCPQPPQPRCYDLLGRQLPPGPPPTARCCITSALPAGRGGHKELQTAKRRATD